LALGYTWSFFVDWDRLLVWLRIVRWLDTIVWLGLVLVSLPLLGHLAAWGLLWLLCQLLRAVSSWNSLESVVIDSLAPELC
jgi:hypothetical protein